MHLQNGTMLNKEKRAPMEHETSGFKKNYFKKANEFSLTDKRALNLFAKKIFISFLGGGGEKGHLFNQSKGGQHRPLLILL